MTAARSAASHGGTAPTSGWNGIHRDARNSDSIPYDLPREFRVESHILGGRAILFGPSIGVDGRRYVTTGQAAPGPRVHIYCDGRPSSDHEADRSRPSSRVCTDVPLFDADEQFFVSDDRHVWCYDLDGRLRWSTDLVDLGTGGGLVSTIITTQGHVGGVTMSGHVVLLDRASGQPARPVLDLRAGPPFDPPPRMPGLWADDAMDPAAAAVIEPAFFGFGSPVTSSPAVNPATGLIHVAATSAKPASSELISLDPSGPEIEIVSRTSIAGRCTASPSVSADGRYVYTVNGAGTVIAVDTESSEIAWQVEGGGAAASPAIGPDGTVYTASTTTPSRLTAIDGVSGTVAWSTNYDPVAAQLLPRRTNGGPLFPSPDPSAVANSVQTVGPNAILMVVAAGYEFRDPTTRQRLLQPHASLLLTIDPATGTNIAGVELTDTCEAVVVTDNDGTVHVCHASLLSGIFTHAIDHHLAPELRTPLHPIGGITTLVPMAE